MKRPRKHSLLLAIASSLACAVAAGVALGPAGGVVAGCLAAAAQYGHELSSRRKRRKEEEQPVEDASMEQTDSAPEHAPDKVDEEPVPLPSAPIAEHVELESTSVRVPVAPFDFSAFFDRVLASKDLYATISEVAREVQERLDAADDEDESTCSVERFLLEQLESEQILTHEGEVTAEPSTATILWRNGSCYLRMPHRIAYGDYLRNMRLEALLNTMLLFQHSEKDLSGASIAELYKLRERFVRSICAQAPFVDVANWTYLAMPWQAPLGPADNGEWSARNAIAEAVEGARLPYRLNARYRVNVNGGDVAVEISATPSSVFPRTTYVDGLGILPTTNHMRRRAASDYAIRVGLLVASHAFRASNRIARVWVAGVLETSTKRSCLYSVCIERRAFAGVNMQRVHNPLATLRSLGGVFEVQNEALVPSEQCFMLEDERFCPTVRHDLWKLSERSLPTSAARSLGTSRVSGLLIHEELPRTLAAEEMMRRLGQVNAREATQQSVRAALQVANNTSDLDVWAAASRVVNMLVDGTLDPTDHAGLYAQFLDGGPIHDALERAQAQVNHQQPQEAMQTLWSALQPSMLDGRYDDTPTIVYRSFDNFVDRVLYNRLNAHDTRTVVLLPDDHIAAHLSLAALALSRNNDESATMLALEHVNWTLQHAPLSMSAHQFAVECLERLGRLEEACDVVRHSLDVAYHAEGIGIAYHSLARLFYQLNKKRACQACYQLCVRAYPALTPIVLAECQALASTGFRFDDSMSIPNIEAILEDEDVPLAPTSTVASILFDGASASIDAEVFPVAHDLMRTITLLTRDDVMFDIFQSLEREPDA